MTALLNAVGIVSSDLPRTLNFYRLLGLDVPDLPDDGHINITLPNGMRLMFDSEDEMHKFRPDWVRQTGNQVALAFECGSPAEVDAIYSRLAGAGSEEGKQPWDAFWGQRYAQLRDPDGVPVDLYASL